MTTARVRLYCLPHAGGTRSAFHGWADALSPQFDLTALQPPGRENLLAAAEELAREVDATDGAYAFFGHSLGGIVAFETVRTLLRRGRPPPLRLLVCGCQPPPREAAAGRDLHQLSDEEFLDAVAALGGLPPEVRDDPELREILVPQLRADYRLAETYEYQAGPALPCPISVLCGRSDALVDTGALHRWTDHTTAGAEVRLIPGNHFLVQDSARCLHDEIRAAFGHGTRHDEECA